MEDLKENLPLLVEGSKGGGGDKPHQPVETPNNLRSVSYAKILIAVGEGELAGNPTGRDILLDGTPLIGANGVNNFGGVTWEWRNGSQNQSYIKGIPDASNELSVGFELKSSTPWIRQITKSSLSAVRVNVNWPALLNQQENGDVTGYAISYSIDISTNGGPFVTYSDYTVNGKTNSGYSRSHRVNLPEGSSWTIRIRKNTPDATTGRIQDKMYVSSITEIVDAKLRYPNTALLFVEFDSSTFPGGRIPKISVKTKGRVIRVPSNYDPESRTYSGIWDGSYKWAYTNNPAWVFLDIVTSQRFGLGGRVSLEQLDKWTLYKVSQYCDVLVSDGKGGMEPRHTCNLYIQSKSEAWAVLRDIASIFNGMTYWDGEKIVCIADMQENLSNILTFGRSDVIDGAFNYTSTDERSIFTSAVISYDDPDNHYNTATEAVWEKDQIIRFGAARQTEIAAIGCTSRGEAQRRGKYKLITNLYNRIVSFRTGLQGFIPKPGQVIGVADPALAGRPFTGRIKSATRSVVTLDRDALIVPGDVMFLTKPDGTSEGRTVISYTDKIVQVSPQYTFVAEANSTWYNEADDLKSQLYRVTKVTRPEEGVFEITGAEYNDSKYDAIDSGARLEDRPVSVVPPSFQAPPEPVTLSSFTYVEQGLAVTTMTIQWPQTPNAALYEVEWNTDLGDWIPAGVTPSLSMDIKGIYSGFYIARVRAINPQGVKSLWTLSETTQLVGKEGAPPVLPTFTTQSEVFGIRLNWAFPVDSLDTAYTEIQESNSALGELPTDLSLVAYPTKTYLKSGMGAAVVKYFRARIVDRTGNVGPWTSWVQGTSSANADEILDYIAGQIGESELSQEINTEINKIPTIEANIVGINAKVDNFTDALAYDKGKSYVVGDIVRQGSKLYQALVPVAANPSGANTPPTASWYDVGQILETTDGLVVQVDQNTAAITEFEAVASNVSILQGKVDDNTAAILSESTVRANADSALSTRVDSVQASAASKNKTYRQTTAPTNSPVGTLVTGDIWFDSDDGNKSYRWSGSAWVLTDNTQIAINTAAIQQEATTRADADTALATTVTTLQAKVDNDITAALQSEATARANADGALSTRIDTTQASVASKNRTYRQNEPPVNTPVGTLVAGDIWYDSNDGNKLYRWSGSAWVASDNAQIAQNTASVQQVTTAQATTDGKLSTMWAVKMQVNQNGQYVAAGVGLGIENGPAGLQSQFLVSADRFAVVNTVAGGTVVTPFVVQGGQTIINSAVIGNATIGFAKINDDVQSTNYIAGVQGWRLGKSGSLEFNGSVAGGGRLTINNQVIEVYDNQSPPKLRVRLGIWE